MAGMRFTRFLGREDEQELEPVETDDDVRRAMARIDSYASGRPLDRRRPSASQVHPLGKVISLWPR
jgi:hypothetical protein